MGQKRRRLALSCVDCRRRKVKCDRTYPRCIRCEKGGYGDKCLYVSHTGAEPSDGLPTPEDERHQRSPSMGSCNTWGEDAEQYETAARKQATTQQQLPDLPETAPRSFAPSQLDPTDRRIARLHGRLMELETMVYAAGGKPRSHEMKLGLLNPIISGAARDPNYYSDKYPLADNEKVLLRGKSFQTQYLGPSNTLAILLQFEDLSRFVREILIAIPSLSNTKQALAKIREKEKHAAKQQYDLSIESLVNMVPEKSFADRLLFQYLDTIETTYRILHVPSFLKDYEAFWNSPMNAKPDFVVLLLISMSCMYCIVPGGEEGFVGRSSARRERATYWINVCSYWLESQSQKHVSMVNYQLMVQIWLAKWLNCIKVKRFWTDSGALVRRFMAAGLHREPSLLCEKINVFDCEMRRRLWYTVLEIDLQTTVDRGITPTLGPMDWDTNPPLNIDDESFGEDTNKLPESKPRSTFTRTSYLAWSAESLPLRIELLYKINSIRNTLDHETINHYDHKLRGHIDEIPLQGWKEDALRNPPIPQGTPLTTSSMSMAHPLIAMTMAQCILLEYIVILHQPFATNSAFKSQHFYSRVARRYACVSTILLYNPQLSVTDTHKQPTLDSKLYINEIQRRFFALFREDYLRAALSLSHSFAVATSASTKPFYLHVSDDNRLITMIEAAVNMLSDRVDNLGQGFHGYWITSSALSFVHSKQSPDVPRSTFAHAAADRVVKLHSAVMDNQLARARRMMLPTDEDDVPARAHWPIPTKANEPTAAPRQTRRAEVESIMTVDGATALQSKAATTPTGATPIAGSSTSTGLNTANMYGLPAGPMDANGGMLGVGFDAPGDPLQDMLFGLENMDWNMLMDADPTAFMTGTWDYPS